MGESSDDEDDIAEKQHVFQTVDHPGGPEFEKTSKKQLSLELQDVWVQLYGDAIVGGEDCVSSAMNLQTFKEVHSENVEDEDVESDDDLDDHQDGTEVHNFEMEDSQIGEPSFYNSFIDERRGRQSGGSARLAEHIAQSKATQQCVIQYLESETSNSNQSNKFSIEAVADAITMDIEKRKKIKKLQFIDFLLDMINDSDIVVEYYYKHMYKEPCMTSQQKGEDWMKDVLNERFQRSRETISRAFHDVLEAITARGNGFHGLASDIIRPKDSSFPIPPQIMNDKRYMLYFKDCIGCIDGTHIGACIPEAQQVRYIGRKGIPTFNTRYHQSQFQNEPPTNMKEAFNRSHSSLRSYIERSFGILKKRWKILGGMPQFSVKTQIDVIMAAFALHNYIRNSDEEDMMFTTIEQHPNYISSDELHDVRGHETNTENISQGTSNEMKRIRDDIAILIWNAPEYGVSTSIGYGVSTSIGYGVSNSLSNTTYSNQKINTAMKKVIKGEFEKIKDIKVEDVSLTCDTPFDAFNNEVNRLSGMDDDLFTYEVEVANIPCDSKVNDDSEHAANDDIGFDSSDVAFTKWLGSKFFNYKTMDHYTIKALWIYWIRGDDEVELTDEESSDDVDEIAKVFRIDTNIFDYETPLCSAFNEFNYLLKVDPDLLTKDIVGFKTYEDYKDDWIYEWNKDVPWVYDKPWLDNGIWKEPKPVKHTCKPFNYKTGCSKRPTCSWREDGYYNGGNLPGAYYIGNSLHYQDLEWYEALKDSELKDEALRNKAIMEGSINDDESCNDCWKRWKSHKITYPDHDEIDYENETHDEREKLCEVHELPVCNIRRFEMIKYSFGQDEEYVAIKEDEYDDLARKSNDACRAYQEIFRMMDEGWMVTRAE
ncbi:VIER F-box protein 2 [Tanacetum coccineum]